MKAISVFKKAAIPALVLLLILAMTVSIIPMVSADDASAPKIASNTLAISGDISLVTYFTPTDLADTDYVTVSVPKQGGGVNTIKTTVAELNASKAANNGRWAVKAPLAAALLTDTVTITWYKGGKAIATYERCAKTDYIDKVFTAAETNAAYASLLDPLKNLLNYGSMAQIQFSHSTDTLANEGLYFGDNPIDGMTAENLYDAKSGEFTSTENIKFLGAQAYLQSAVRLRVYFNAPQGATVTISDGSKTKQVRINKDETGYYVNINNIASFNFDKEYTVTVTCGSETATAKYSVLGYALDVVDSYKITDNNQKNSAKALYHFYAFTKAYTNNSYTPGPASCTHTRAHTEKYSIVCSDCGKALAEPIKLDLKAAPTNTIYAGVPTDVKFTLAVSGKVNLQSIVTTLKAQGVTFTFKSIEFPLENSSSIQGEAAINIVLDAGSAIKESAQLATVTYTVTAEAGTYKIAPTVREAYNEAGQDIKSTVKTAYAVLEVAKSACDCDKTNAGYDSMNGQHRFYCNDCRIVSDWENHTAASEWTPVIGPMDINGKIYEEKICSVCEKAAETREMYYKNSSDTIYVGNTVINPIDNQYHNQTVGYMNPAASSYNTFVVSDENFIDVDGNRLTLTDTFKLSGWFAVSGGVERYVVKINNDEWVTLEGNPSTPPVSDSGIYKAINDDTNITGGAEKFTNSSYQGKLTVPNIKKYGNQTITLTFAAVPASNPGTPENPNVLIIGVVENLFVTCNHDSEFSNLTATSSPTVFTATCVCGKTVEVTDVNEEGLKMFNADEIAHRASGQGGANYSITKMSENGLDFVRFELSADKSTGSEYFIYLANKDSGNATNLTYGLGDAFMIIYRANQKYLTSLYMFANHGEGWMNKSVTLSNDGEWHFAIFDTTAFDTSKDLTQFRLDIFDDAVISKGAAIDIAYMGFFNDANHAMENYKLAIEKYNFDKANWVVNLDAFVVDGTTYNNKADNTNGLGPVKKLGGEWSCISVDMTDYTAATFDKSLTFRGWLVTPSGAEGIYYTITDENGNVSDLKFYLKPSALGADNGIVGATTQYMYGDGRLAGSAFQSAKATFDLSGYDGQTVSIDVILKNNFGQTATIMKITNITLAECTHANAVTKSYMAPTTTEAGWLAHKACDDCGKIWDGEGNPIDAIPTIAVIVPTTEKYWGVNELAAKVIYGADGSTFKTPVVSADRSYTRFERDGTSSYDGAMYLVDNKDSTEVTGQYLIYKYRTDHAADVQIFATTDGGANGSANFYSKLIADGQWHIYVVNLAEKLPAYVKAEADGTYVLTWARIDIFDITASTGYFDMSWMVTCDNPAEALTVMMDGDVDLCPHIASANPVYTDLGDNHATPCLICKENIISSHFMVDDPVWSDTEKAYTSDCACGVTLNQEMLHYADPIGKAPVNMTATQENGFMRYSVTNPDDRYIHIYSDGTAVTGKYMVIKYRAYDPNSTSLAHRTYYAGSIAGANSSAAGNGDGHVSVSGSFIADGLWHYQIVSISDSNTQFGANADGTYTWKYLRFGFDASVYDGTAYVDIESLAFADNMTAVNRYIYGDDATYKSEGPTGSTVGSKDNFLDAKVIVENGESFVRYSPVSGVAIPSDAFFYPYQNGTAVTGKFMVIKYRVSNGGTALSTGQVFASTVASGGYPGVTGSSANYATPKSWVADGQWHTMMIQPKDENVSFTPNSDGTYSWKYLRIDVKGITANGYLDIAEIAFFDNAEAADEYACKNDVSTMFTVNLDISNNELNGSTFLDKAVSQTSTANLDMSKYAPLETPKSLVFGGWLCTRGGVASYNIRVTSIDGVAVTNPTLVLWQDVSTAVRNDIYTGYGKGAGYTSACAKGAGINKAKVDLTAWAGHTINFEIVAVTNAGIEIVAINVINVTVPAAQ